MPRKSTYSIEKTEKFLEAIRAGSSRKAACGRAGFSEDTLARWLSAHEDFAEGLTKAESENEIRNVAIIQKAASGYDSSIVKTSSRMVVKMKKTTFPDGTVVEEPITITLTNTEKTESTKFEPAMAAWMLEHHPRHRDQWSKAIEVTGAGGGPIRVEFESSVDKVYGQKQPGGS